MKVNLNSFEIGAAIAQYVGCRMGLLPGAKVGTSLRCIDGEFSAVAEFDLEVTHGIPEPGKKGET